MATISFERKIVIRNKKGVKSLKNAVKNDNVKNLKTTKDIQKSSKKAEIMVKDYFKI